MLTDACYDDFGQFDPAGMAPVQQDGYWGYINASGETIIGHYFENAESFVGECAIVGGSGNWGAIDRQAIIWCSRNITGLRSRMGF